MKKHISTILKTACLACICMSITIAQQTAETTTSNNDTKKINLKEKIFYVIDNYLPALASNPALGDLIETESPEAIEWNNSSTIADILISDSQEHTYLHWKIYKNASAITCLKLDIFIDETVTTKTIAIDDDILILDQIIPGFSSTIIEIAPSLREEQYVMIWVNFDAYAGGGLILQVASDPNLQSWLQAVHDHVTKGYAKPKPSYGLVRLSEALAVVNIDPNGAFYIVY